MIMNYVLICLFIAILAVYNYVASRISRKYGAKTKVLPTKIKSRDYTNFLLAIPQVGLVLNVIITFNSGNYEIIPLLSGFTLMFLGMYFTSIVRKNLGKNWIPSSKTSKEQELVIDGIYSNVRHPFYLSILTQFLGIAVISWNLYSLLFFILAIIVIVIRIKREELELIAKFGEQYGEYAKKTPMLIPKLK